NLQKEILNLECEETEKNRLLRNLMKLEEEHLNIMITGATGCGKSSTINALFDTEVAKVGVGVDPETMEITKFEFGNITLWDTPGLGDGKEADNRHSKNIIDKLLETDENGNPLIDLVLVILDGSSRDLGTSYELINEVIIKTIGPENSDRILIAINQADIAMSGRYWNFKKNRPEKKLEEFLDKKVESVKNRIKEATGVEVDPIYYCAGYKEEGCMQTKPYNLTKLLSYIVDKTPSEKRIFYSEATNTDSTMWKHNDDLEDYRTNIFDSIKEGLGNALDLVGNFVSGVLGVIDSIGSFIGNVFGGLFW
ncbi:MAG: 50S ribosome-binding GTPase, partial [Lachnospiraceae bacterium]|nr:50S ribosome-binding GTPase [Lachnospiraceae bacterium]